MPLDELCVLLARHARDDATTAVEDLLIGREEADTSLPPASGTRMSLIAQGAKRLAYDDRIHHFQAGQYLVSSIAMPLKCHFIDATPQRPALGLCLLLHSSDVADLLMRAASHPPARTSPSHHPPSPSATPPTPSWTPRSAWSASSTSRATGRCSPHWSNARSCGA